MFGRPAQAGETCVCVCVCVCVCKACVSDRAVVCFSHFSEGGGGRASTINVLIYAATGSFHYAYNYH